MVPLSWSTEKNYKLLMESSGKAELRYMDANQSRVLSEIRDCSSDGIAISDHGSRNLKDKNT